MMNGRNGLRPRQGGYTLVELMTAGVVLGLAVAGSVSLWRTGREAEKLADLRRQATLALASALDGPHYHYANYTTLANYTGALTLDEATPGAFNADLRIQVSAEDSTLWGVGTSQYNVRFKTITGTIAWSRDGVADSVVMKKRLSKVKQ